MKTAAFILSYNRPEKVHTYTLLKRLNYKNPIYIIISSDDPKREAYENIFKNELIIFHRKNVKFDIADNTPTKTGVVFARNACWDIAENFSLDGFVQLDDDYRQFQWKFNKQRVFAPISLYNNITETFDAFFNFLKQTSAKCIAMSQGGDWIGGKDNIKARQINITQKCMNVFFCLTNRKIDFVGRMNEDVNAYVLPGRPSNLFFTTWQLAVIPQQTQKNEGGLTEMYLESGTYVKSFYSVMMRPDCVKIGALRDRIGARMHHAIKWNNCTPKILRE